MRTYHLLKIITIALGVISIPLGTYIGYLFGVENYSRAFILLGVATLIYVADCLICWRMMEVLTAQEHRSEGIITKQQSKIADLLGEVQTLKEENKQLRLRKYH